MAKKRTAKEKANMQRNNWRQVAKALGVDSLGLYDEGVIAIHGNNMSVEVATRQYLREIGKNPM